MFISSPHSNIFNRALRQVICIQLSSNDTHSKKSSHKLTPLSGLLQTRSSHYRNASRSPEIIHLPNQLPTTNVAYTRHYIQHQPFSLPVYIRAALATRITRKSAIRNNFRSCRGEAAAAASDNLCCGLSRYQRVVSSSLSLSPIYATESPHEY